MTKCKQFPIQFPSIKSKKVLANFQGGEITSDGGVLLLKRIDQKLKLTASIAKYFLDKRRKGRIFHSFRDMLRQRIYAIAAGYEDLNDHNVLRKDTAFQVAVGKDKCLASSPTLCRFENSFSRKLAMHIHKEMLRVFVSSFSAPPKELVLDFDATDLPIHGDQEGKAFHGYYGHDCFLPLHVFCKDKLLISYLRKSNQDAAKHAWAILALLVKYFRKIWPNVKIIFRGDCSFCRQKILNWCDRYNVGYILAIGCNSRLKKALQPYLEIAKNSEKGQVFAQFAYRAYSWKYPRKVIGKAEYTSKGENTRTIVTNLDGVPEELYKKLYCTRGNMENRIAEQLLLFSDRVSCHKWWGNQMRILLAGLAYILLENLRSLYLKGTEFAKSQVDTIRLRFLKIGALITKNTRRILFCFSSYYPYQNLFIHLVFHLNSS